MHQIKPIISFLALLMLAACIKPYTPVIEGEEANQLVVSGRITDTEGWQEVSVSLSTPVETAENIPITGCEVIILDDHGNIFVLDPSDPGK